MKIAFEILNLEVDKLYMKEIPETNIKEIEEHCLYITEFIEACGWKTEEYLEEYVHRGLKDFITQNKN